ncbi:hypothetical protein K503DRAFT_869021 [Rhizopogon vinicolor AM-OR11-026]|uniref:Uncharacterized protein n=1 Tax=Rhizopogon vinicolor AM-OR11-026 TaxID=1314800 RepID=A0A1B7MNV7_9AGAM|nr:hypothetical protein K503DRAFT_869021 [Rhizopogon vinicolor AM-OR11-026]
MSSLPSKSFAHLKITPELEDHREFMGRGPFRLTRPKPQPRVQFYGYAISPYWLLEFAVQNCPDLLPDPKDKSYEYTAMQRGYELLRDWLCIYSLDRQYCFNPKGSSVPPEWIEGVNDDEPPEDLEMVDVLAVCSDREDEFERRPTQEQLDFLTKLIGYSPKWWVSCDWEE